MTGLDAPSPVNLKDPGAKPPGFLWGENRVSKSRSPAPMPKRPRWHFIKHRKGDYYVYGVGSDCGVLLWPERPMLRGWFFINGVETLQKKKDPKDNGRYYRTIRPKRVLAGWEWDQNKNDTFSAPIESKRKHDWLESWSWLENYRSDNENDERDNR